MNVIDSTCKELELAIDQVSQYESELKVIATINDQSIQRINNTITDPTYISIVNTFSFLPPDVKLKLITAIDKEDISSFSELLTSVAALVSEELTQVKQWASDNRC